MMNSSNLTKFAVGLALAMGLLASFANDSSSTSPEEAPVSLSEAPVEVPEAVVEETIPRNLSTARKRKPTLSSQYKEAQGRRGEAIESIPPDWGERGMPPTDSVSVVEKDRRTK